MASSIRVVHPNDDDSFLYYENVAVVLTRLRENENEFRVGDPVDHPKQFTFNKDHVYHFTRSAKTTIRDYMTSYLLNVLVPDAVPEIVEEIGEQLRAAFGFLYNYESYKGSLSAVHQAKNENLNMLIFINREGTRLVAHVTFHSISRLAAPDNFTVDAKLKLRRFQYFDMQETNFEQVMNEVMSLNPHANNEETQENNEETQENNEETQENNEETQANNEETQENNEGTQENNEETQENNEETQED